MLIPPLDGTIRVASVFGVDWGRYRRDGLDLAQLHERLKALEAHVRASCVTEATFLAKLRPIRTVLCGAVEPALSGVVGSVSGLVLR